MKREGRSLRMQVLSDIHLEYHGAPWAAFVAEVARDDVDVIVLAGDICSAAQLREVLLAFLTCDAEVVYVLGNHEFYGSGFGAIRAELAHIAASSPRLHWLDNSVAHVCGRRFVGTTLWFPDAVENAIYSGGLSDFHLIDDFAAQVYQENARAVAFLRETVVAGDIVVTHHLPSWRSVSPRFLHEPLTRFFVTPLDDLVEASGVPLWIHGHTHDSFDYMLGHTRVVCNPLGYLGHGTNGDFDGGLVVEVSWRGP